MDSKGGRIKNKFIETLRSNLLYLLYKDMEMNDLTDLQKEYDEFTNKWFDELKKNINEFNRNEFKRLGKLIDNIVKKIDIIEQFEEGNNEKK